ncbi:hypothetical protein [Spiroplasma endosymbiont of Phyllotreta cruciferae]|uniref:hypothetical protein n=1 Tax=Spiroplasma endosymbiont of Phyllotreta cruciferae TaxID=2886375 RepID=UPI00209E8295|nr:hypothetical protein [Spiroplasma endosymbiont of Phyllotreta cruciferae]
MVENIHKEDKDSKFYWSKDWKITPPSKIKTNGGTIDNIISTQASSYFRRKDEFGNTVGQVQIRNIIKWALLMLRYFKYE